MENQVADATAPAVAAAPADNPYGFEALINHGTGISYAVLAILAIMSLPFITSVSREVIRMVPTNQREGSLGLGAKKWETVRSVVLPSARSGKV